MPNIREAPAQNLEIRPSETGIDAFQSAARRVGAFYGQAADDFTSTGQRFAGDVKAVGDIAVKAVEHHEISTGSANFSQMQANLIEQWNQTAKNADPNDPTVAAQFREKVLEPALEKFGEQGFLTEGGQNWAQGHVNALRQHLFEKTSADMSTLAGEAVKVNARKTENNLASTARMDPSSTDFLLSTAESSLGGVVDSSPTLRAADAGRVKQEILQHAKEAIVRAAGLGIIERNPNTDLGAFEKRYGDYMPAGEMQQLQKAAQTQQRKDILTERQTQLIQKQQAELAVHAGANKNMADNVRIDPNTNRPIISPQFFNDALDLAKKYPDAPNAANVAKTFLDWGEHQQNLKDEAPRTDQTVKADLMSRMFDPDKPTTKVDILRAEANGKLSTHDGSIMRELAGQMETSPIRGPLYQTAIEGAKERVGFGLIVDGHERFANAIQAFMPEYMKAMRDGTLKPNALDLRDETSLLRQSIARFEPSMDERMFAHSLKKYGLKTIDDINPSGQGERVTGVEVKNAPIRPLQSDLDYVKAHPETRDKFIRRFGREP